MDVWTAIAVFMLARPILAWLVTVDWIVLLLVWRTLFSVWAVASVGVVGAFRG